MTGNKCQFYNCGKTRRNFPNLHLFRFPKDERCEIWVENSGNTSLLSLTKEKLYSRYICQEHFAPESFMNSFQKRLTHAALPCKYVASELPSTSSSVNNDYKQNDLKQDCVTVVSPTNTNIHCTSETKELSSPRSSSKKSTSQESQLSEMPSSNSIEKNSLKVSKLKEKLKAKSKLLRNKLSHISKLKKKITSLKVKSNFKNLLLTHQFPSVNSKALVTMQLKRRGDPWTLNEKNLALSIFRKSQSTYRFLHSLKINLPGISTIRRWIGEPKLLTSPSKLITCSIPKDIKATD